MPFEFIFDYEWDILTAAPLEQIYPGKYDNRTVVRSHLLLKRLKSLGFGAAVLITDLVCLNS